MKDLIKLTKIVVAVALILFVSGVVFADPRDNDPFDSRYDGPFGNRGNRGGMMGYGMMHGGMMGRGMGPGMRGPYGNSSFSGGDRLGIEDVEESLEDFIRYNRINGLEIAEIMEFEYNFYAQLSDPDTGVGAMELLIDPYTGYVSAEPGPNMMWNTKYGHMNGWGRSFSQSMRIKEEDALRLAQESLDYYGRGLKADRHADEFYGYYTLHVLENDKIVGMLSVNGYDGEIWYHNWHGGFLGMTQGHD
jgi:hypothetical protein